MYQLFEIILSCPNFFLDEIFRIILPSPQVQVEQMLLVWLSVKVYSYSLFKYADSYLSHILRFWTYIFNIEGWLRQLIRQEFMRLEIDTRQFSIRYTSVLLV